MRSAIWKKIGATFVSAAMVALSVPQEALAIGNPFIGFESNEYEVSESAGSVTIGISRSGDRYQIAIPIDVSVVADGGSATVGDDYEDFNGSQVSYPAGGVTPNIQYFTVNIIDDSTEEPDEYVDIVFNPGPFVPVDHITTRIKIIDDDDANSCPEIDPMTIQRGNWPDDDTYTMEGNVTDDGLPDPPAALTINWSKQSGPGNVTFDDATDPRTDATFDAPGSYVLRLSVSDGDTDCDKFEDVTIEINEGPTVDAGTDQNISSLSTNLTGTASDDGLPTPPVLTTTWSKLIGPGTVTFGDVNAVNTTADFSASGVYVLQLQANDSAVINSDTVTITINLPPTVDAGPDQGITLPAGADLDGTVTDDGFLIVPVAVTWSVDSGPGGVSFGDANAVDTTASFGTDGIYVLRLEANDGEHIVSDTVTITVSPEPVTNDPPTVDAGVDQAIELPDSASLDGTVTDDGLVVPYTVTWSMNSGPGIVTFGDASAEDTSASFSTDGVYVLQLEANDGEFIVSDTVTITVDPEPVTNDPPTVDAGLDQTITLPAGADLDGTVTDDGLVVPYTVTWSKDSGPGIVTFGNANAEDTTASFSTDGIYVLKLEANDGEYVVSDIVTITVNPEPVTNDPPTVDAGLDQTIELPNSASLDGTVTDDGLVVPYTVTWSKDSGPGVVTFGDASAEDTTASFSTDGIYVLKLEANDGEFIVSDTVTITVDPEPTTNDPPTVDAGPDQTITLPAGASLDGTATDDGEIAPLTTLWTQVGGPGIVTFGNATAVDTTASFSIDGVYTLQLEANDGEFTETDTVTITVNPEAGGGNVPPDVDAGPDLVVVLPGIPFIDAHVVDDGLIFPLVINWTQVSGPLSAVINDPSSIDTSVTVSETGVYVFQIEANDGEYAVTDTVTITVNSGGGGNVAPTVDAGSDFSIPVGDLAALNATVTDDGLPAPYSVLWSQVSGPGGSIFDNPTVEDTFVTFDTEGTYVIQLEANDGELSAADTLTVTVTSGGGGGNNAPIVDAGSDGSIGLLAGGVLNGSVLDDGPHSIDWSVLSGPGIGFFADSSDPQSFVTFDTLGTYVLELKADDGEFVVTDTVTITVFDDMPVILEGEGEGEVSAFGRIEKTLIARMNSKPSAASASKIKFKWMSMEGPGAVSFNEPHAIATKAQFTQPGQYNVGVLVSNGVITRTASAQINVVRALSFNQPQFKNRFDPSRENIQIPFVSNQAGSANVKIYTIRGRLVREFNTTVSGTGVQSATWNGRNGDGEMIASGIYLVNIEVGGSLIVHKRKIVAIK